MACGAKYSKMLVTESGLTPDNPWEWWPGPEDYDEWADVAGVVEREVLRRWAYLLDTEQKVAQMEDPPVDGPFPARDQLETKLKEFAAQLSAVHSVLRELFESAAKGEWSWETSIRRAIEAGRTGTCALELIDHAIEYYQRPPYPSSFVPRDPGTGKEEDSDTSPKSGLGGVAITMGLLGGAYLFWRRKRKQR